MLFKNTCLSVKPAKLSSPILFVNPTSTCTCVGIETESEDEKVEICLQLSGKSFAEISEAMHRHPDGQPIGRHAQCDA